MCARFVFTLFRHSLLLPLECPSSHFFACLFGRWAFSLWGSVGEQVSIAAPIRSSTSGVAFARCLSCMLCVGQVQRDSPSLVWPAIPSSFLFLLALFVGGDIVFFFPLHLFFSLPPLATVQPPWLLGCLLRAHWVLQPLLHSSQMRSLLELVQNLLPRSACPCVLHHAPTHTHACTDRDRDGEREKEETSREHQERV